MGLTFGPSTSHPSFCNYPPNVALGASNLGGFLICKAGGVAWVVSPRSAEVSRGWYSRTDANTTAQSVTGCTGWFIPTCTQFQNPGHLCRSFWGPSPCLSSPAKYWSSTPVANPYSVQAYTLNFPHGCISNESRSGVCCVRAFRCVTY